MKCCLLLALALAFWARPGAASGRGASESDEGFGASIADFFAGLHGEHPRNADPLRIQVGDADAYEAAPEYWSDLAELQLSFKQPPERVEALSRAVSAAAGDPAIEARARLRLAKFEFEFGKLDEAGTSLLRAHERLPGKLEPAWAELYARVLMAQGRYGDAVGVLDPIDLRDDPDGFLRYNVGVALIRDRRLGDGRVTLDRVGRLEGSSDTVAALRDKANVTLGWHFLRYRLGGAARPLFMRVRLEGPDANRALLGLGWSELAPTASLESRTDVGVAPLTSSPLRADATDNLSAVNVLGVLLRRAPLDDPDDYRGKRGLVYRRSPETVKQAGLRHALVEWRELVERDPQDPAVQEAWLAIPFVLDELGAHAEATQNYEQAVQRLEAAHARNVSSARAIDGGCLAEILARRATDPDATSAWPGGEPRSGGEDDCLQPAIADGPFAESLNDFGDLDAMSRALESWRARLARMEDVAGRVESAAAPDPDDPMPSAPTSGFGGSRERLGELRQRLGELRQRLDSLAVLLAHARSESARRVNDLAQTELASRNARIEQYLFAARLALTRRYDRVAHAADHEEVGTKGKAAAAEWLPHGEFDIHDPDRPSAGPLQGLPP